VLELAEVENGHSHRFRDTFAVALLAKGVSLENVSVLLGHSSVKITEGHYKPRGSDAASAARSGRGPRLGIEPSRWLPGDSQYFQPDRPISGQETQNALAETPFNRSESRKLDDALLVTSTSPSTGPLEPNYLGEMVPSVI